MNLLRKMFPVRRLWTKMFSARRLSLTDPSGWGVRETDSGELATAINVLGLSAVWACVNLLAGTIASLPLMVYRSDGKGNRVSASDHPLYRLLHDSPNADQTALDFWEFIAASIELWGNGYASIERIGDKIVALTPIAPDVVSVRRLQSGAIEYRWTADGKSFVGTDADVLHIRGFGGDPLGGKSTLSFGRETFGLGLAARKSAASTFKNGMRPSVVLSFKDFLEPEYRNIVEEKLAEKFMGAVNAGRPFIAEGATTVAPLSIDPVDAQMLETMGFSIEDICRFFGVPPHMIGHTAGNTKLGSSIGEQTQGFEKFTLRRRVKRIEQSVMKQLLTPADVARGITIEFNLEGLLRGDSKARSEFYRTMTQIGAMTINEVRALENMTPVDGGDVPRMQAQNIPITEAPGIGHNGGPSLEDAA